MLLPVLAFPTCPRSSGACASPVLTRLAGPYNVDVRDLVRCAGLSDDGVPDPRIDEEAEVGRAFEYVMVDPRFRFGTRPSGSDVTGGETVHRRDV